MDTKTGLPENGRLWILTGPRGSGKTTLCRRLAAEAKALGWDVAGVLSPAVFTGGEKTGIEALDLRGGDSRQFARRPVDMDGSTSRHPSWIFDQIALAWGNQVLARAVPCDMLVVDELGPLEFEAGLGWSAGLKALDSRTYQVATGDHSARTVGGSAPTLAFCRRGGYGIARSFSGRNGSANRNRESDGQLIWLRREL